MDVNWIVRLLEQVVMIFIDIYIPSEKPRLRETAGYSEEMYLETLGQCEIPQSIFHPLNHAMLYHSNNGACKCGDSRSQCGNPVLHEAFPTSKEKNERYTPPKRKGK